MRTHSDSAEEHLLREQYERGGVDADEACEEYVLRGWPSASTNMHVLRTHCEELLEGGREHPEVESTSLCGGLYFTYSTGSRKRRSS